MKAQHDFKKKNEEEKWDFEVKAQQNEKSE